MPLPKLAGATSETHRLFFYDKLIHSLQQVIAVVGVDNHIDRLKQVKAENTHYGLSVDHIAAGAEVNVYCLGCHDIYKIANILDRFKLYFYLFHIALILSRGLAAILVFLTVFIIPSMLQFVNTVKSNYFRRARITGASQSERISSTSARLFSAI